MMDESQDDVCGARLEVTIKNTTYSFKCTREPGHPQEHTTPQGSCWKSSEPQR